MADTYRKPATLYVSPRGSDLSNGSAGAPLRTIVTASRRALPGATVLVAPGVYEGGFVTSTSGTEQAPIAYVSMVTWGAKIVPSRRAGLDIGWKNQGAYTLIEGFEMDGLRAAGNRHDTPWRIGIYTTGSGSAIRDSHVHNIGFNSCNRKGGAGIEGDSYYGASNIDLTGNVVHDIGSNGCRFVQGIYETASGRIIGNTVYRVSGWGIHLWHDAHDITIARNVVFENTRGGIVVGGGEYVHTKGPADHVTVTENAVFDNTGFGIIEDGDTGFHNQFLCNLSYANGRNWRLLTSKVEPDGSACR